MDLQGRENTNLPLYQQQLRETETKIENLLKAITEGVFMKSTKTLLEELEAAKEELENRIALEKLEKPQISEEFMRFWLHRFRKLDMAKKEHRQMLIDVFINAMFLYDDKMLITFNYKEGTKTITFDDIKNEGSEEIPGSDLDCRGAPKRNLFYLQGQERFFVLLHKFRFCGIINSKKLEFDACKVMLRNCKVDVVVIVIVFCYNEITKM